MRDTVSIWLTKDDLLIHSSVNSIGHFGVIRDYTITLESGHVIGLDRDIVEIIVKDFMASEEAQNEQS